jgi:predicted TIM-barrel fold metal-dependent hydrolase
MAMVTSRFSIGAFKVYPHTQAQRLDHDEVGGRFIDQAQRLGVRVIAAHRGISGGGGYEVAGSPVDVVRAAKKFPGVNFLIYHSGWEPGGAEDHAFDPSQTNPTGVDRFIKALIENGIGPNANVYAELGSTWHNLIPRPADAGHVLGKLLRYVGENRVLYGTDSVFNGVPQSQIAALRTFTIPQSMQDQFGYPALTPAVRSKIFGLNAAAVYGVDPSAVRYVIRNDDVERLRIAWREDPRSVPMPHRHEYVGPRTRREFLTFLSRGDHPKIG